MMINLREGDNNYLYVNPQYMRDIQQFIKLGRFKISEDKYRYSTNNIVLPFSFDIEELFLQNETANIKISAENLKKMIQMIKNKREQGRMNAEERHFYYTKYNEFMNLEDFLEFYHKYLVKRKEESEKKRYKIRYTNEIEKIKQLKTGKYLETETLRLGGTLNKEQKERLDQKIIQFQEGLNYTIKKLNYHQAEGMLRKLNTVPQPPMKMGLGKRTKLFSFKTGAGFIKALDDVIKEPGLIDKHPDLKQFQEQLDEQKEMLINSHNKNIGELMKKQVQDRISGSISQIDKIFKNGPRSRNKKGSTNMYKLSSSVSKQNLGLSQMSEMDGNFRKSQGGISTKTPNRPQTGLGSKHGKRSGSTLASTGTIRKVKNPYALKQTEEGIFD